MSVSAKFKLELKDVRAKAFDIDTDVYFTVTGETLEGINEIADEVSRSFVAFTNPDAEDKVRLEKFIK
ncbi:MAG: hypothetical protein R2685_10500 [Candidatus Nitrosocosmicus sp.]|nr:hypothetical protein [Candidatus Nitrosocosmicus sp.]